MKPERLPFFTWQQGLTLIELMISMAIGLVILTAISVLFTSHNKQQVELDKANRLIDNGRYALELLSENLRLSGYYGEFDGSTIAVPGALPDPCDVAQLGTGLRFHIQAYDAPDATTAAVPPVSCGLAGLVKPGSDVLVIRHVLTTRTLHSAVPVGNTTFYVQGSQCESDTPTYRVDTAPANLDRLTIQCGASANKAPVNRLIQEVYFVAPNNVGTDGIPTLKKVELKTDGTFSTPIPLVEGIEYLQLSYGVDNVTVDGVPDSGPDGDYNDCDGTSCNTDWDKVVSVKIYLIARNIEETRDFDDPKTYSLGPGGTFDPSGAAVRYRRQAYVETVRLPNPAMRREQ